MASLTTTLDQPSQGKPVINPGPAGPSLFGSLADLAGGVLQGYGNNWADKQKIDQTKAANALEGGIKTIFDNYDNQTKAMGDMLQGNDARIAEMQGEVDKADKIRKAAYQGRIPLEAVDAQVNTLVENLYSKYPDQKSFIAQYLSSRGYDHYLNREVMLSTAERAAQDKETVDGQASMVHAAYARGLVVPGMSPDQIMDAGRKVLYAEGLIKQQKDALDMAKASLDIDKTKHDMFKAEAQSKGRQAFVSDLETHTGIYSDQIANLFAAAQTDDQLDQLVGLQDKLAGAATTWYNHAKQNAIANGTLDVKDSEWADKEFDRVMTGIKEHFFGDTSEFAQRDRAYKNMQTTLGLSADKAVPVWAMMHHFFGPAAIQIFGATPEQAFSPQLIDKLKLELQHYDPTDPNSAMGLMAQMREIIKGNNSLNTLMNMPKDKITADHIKAFNQTSVYNSKQINLGRATPDNHQQFLNSLGALGVYASNIEPNYRNVDGLYWMSGALINNDNVNALVAEQNNPQFGEQAKDTMLISRAGAARILEAGKQIPVAGKLTGFGITYDRKQQKFVITVPKGATQVIGTNPVTMMPITANVGAPNAPESARKQALAMNASLNFLVRTAQFDPNLPKGVTPAQIAEFYATGTPLPTKTEGVKPQPSQSDQFTKSLNDLEGYIAADQADAQKNMPYKQTANFVDPGEAMTTIQTWGASKAAAAGILGALNQESSLDLNASGDSGLGVSLAQWHPERQAVAAKAGFDLHTAQGALGFIHYEFLNGDDQAKKAWELLKDPKITPEKATEIFTNYFERPAKESADMDARRRYARQFFGQG